MLKCGRIMGAAVLFLLSACDQPPAAIPVAAGACGPNGKFDARLYGSLETALDWGREQLLCQGMPRPNSAGARLRFAGSVDVAGNAVPIAFIFGIPGLERGKAMKELLTNVTVIDESQGRFFATQDIEACWSDIESQTETGSASEFEIRGILYCVSPLAELHGTGSVRLSEVAFTGLVDWKSPQ